MRAPKRLKTNLKLLETTNCATGCLQISEKYAENMTNMQENVTNMQGNMTNMQEKMTNIQGKMTNL